MYSNLGYAKNRHSVDVKVIFTHTKSTNRFECRMTRQIKSRHYESEIFSNPQID